MAVDIHKLIATINPDVYCKKSKRKEVNESIKKDGYLKTALKEGLVETVESEYMNFDKAEISNPFSLMGVKNPIEKHVISYDSPQSSLESIYFWIINYLNVNYNGERPTKFTDNFSASPGSAYYGELGQRATIMQTEGMRVLGSANQVLKSVLSLIYDLKEFEIRLQIYDKLNSKKKEEQDAAKISLKQVWMDTVDAKRNNTSLKAMAFGQGSAFVTLIDGFMAAEDESLKYKGSELDLNERVKRIIQQKIMEFNIWVKESEKELRKRYEIEKLYLKSQVNTVKLYARWAKPYLRAARALEQGDFSKNVNLVNAFGSASLELTIMGQGNVPVSDLIDQGAVDKIFRKVEKRFYAIIILELSYGGTPERTQQGNTFKGYVEAKFTSYALSKDEIKILKEEMEKDDFGEVFKQIEGATTDSLEKLQADLDYFLDEKKENKEEKKEESNDPFTALFSLFKSEKKDDKDKKDKPKITSDSEIEKAMRSVFLIESRRNCQKMYESFKKSKGLPGLG